MVHGEFYTFSDGRTALEHMARVLRWHGEDVAPRGMNTKELRGCTIEVSSPADTLCSDMGRGMNVPFAAVEALQLIGGFSDPELTIEVNPTMKQFADEHDGRLYFHGAYGTRLNSSLVNQLESVEHALRHDEDTRQAVATIWHPALDSSHVGLQMKDLPCTIALQFFIRQDLLELHTVMRSNDLWWGFTYDVFQFTQLQLTMASVLGLEVGSYFHHPMSLHLYERDWNKIDGLKIMPHHENFHHPIGIDSCSNIREAMAVARGLTDDAVVQPSNSEAWYRDRIKEGLRGQRTST
jgi:hypothetical protein